ncbi:PREDICTED: uncharacterized protein LOC109580752 [Amphimedon queenslandica]|uniref:DED domain-containing protein n=1 Tax=Amphimedon queenslandica TaxID=400682 RepID=A0A1X7VB70_AMPQE|nr:PREDICTED: uncharacterized protein LOC109580752 [Amphimedon queenslandica]|eukprot:XP_019849811.1 PREDICTED: uncharacterized protein LOC109580752 [Amphimedon queenslandica]
MERDMFQRYLKELAEQLGPSDLLELPGILIRRGLLPNHHISVTGKGPSISELVTSFEVLFLYLSEQSLISCHDITLLKDILDDLSKPYLLYPFYEACIGKRQLSSNGSSITAISNVAPSKKKTQEDFALLLLQIGNRLSSENVRTLCYLLQDLLSRFKAAIIQDGVEVLQYVKQRHFITPAQPCFLLTLLRDIDREDLCHIVEEYKMTYLDQTTPPLHSSTETIDIRSPQACCSFFSARAYFKSKKQEDEGNSYTWTRREYRFRLAIKKLADKLCPRDLASMKLLAQSFIPPAELDKIETIIDLFWLLEDHGRLSIDNLYILEELLDEKNHLLNSIYLELSSGSSQPSSRENSLTRRKKHKVVPRDETKSETKIENSFQKMLKCIGSGLTQKETKHLKVLDTAHEETSIKTGIELMYHWKKVRVITERNLDLLRKGLYAIGRQDLCQHISEYHSAVQLAEPNPCLPIEETVTDGSHNVTQTCQKERENSPIAGLQCTENYKETDMKVDFTKEELTIQLQKKDRLIEILKEKLGEQETALQQKDHDNKQLEHQNHRLLLHNHELTVEVAKLEKQLDTNLLATNASKNGIFLSTPV